jgi:voltage-gated potassium channel
MTPDTVLASAWKGFGALELEYLEQFVVALVPMSVTVLIHGQGMWLAGRSFRHFGAGHAGKQRRRGSATFLLIGVVAIILAAHFLEVCAWAAVYLLAGMLANVPDAMTFSINSYTTLGASNIQLAGRWRGFDGFEAMTAMLMFGWSTAVLAVVVQKTHSVED